MCMCMNTHAHMGYVRLEDRDWCLVSSCHSPLYFLRHSLCLNPEFADRAWQASRKVLEISVFTQHLDYRWMLPRLASYKDLILRVREWQGLDPNSVFWTWWDLCSRTQRSKEIFMEQKKRNAFFLKIKFTLKILLFPNCSHLFPVIHKVTYSQGLLILCFSVM